VLARVHGLIFFYIQKFAETLNKAGGGKVPHRTTVSGVPRSFLPTKSYPDEDAVALLSSMAEANGDSLPALLERFGLFLGTHLVKVAGQHVDPSWKTLDLIENTESVIHTMVRATTPEATPPVIQTVRTAVDELQVIYTSSRKLCQLAGGIIRGVAEHYGEPIEISQDSCMLRGAPFCTFLVRLARPETNDSHASHVETLQLQPSADGHLSVSGDGPLVTGRAFDEPLPTIIGGHRVLRLLGQGGMGRVYLARDELLDREVAIKTMLPSRADDPSARKRFLRESRAAAKVEHENVVTIYQVGEHPLPGHTNGLPFFVMQRLSGSPLTVVREQLGRFPVREALRIAREIASGLHAAHAVGLIHRDIKPENIFLEGSNKRVKIIDFGLASDHCDDNMRLTVDGAIVGTPAYMAPERMSNKDVIDSKADIFGLGVLLYEMLSGEFPFEGTSIVSMLASISQGNPQPLSERLPELPTDVATLVMQMIAREKAGRPASCEAIAQKIAAIEATLGSGPD
jgi:tRNA A-37 threonylcarbamoyl transferase component Bud32/predicted hydrocarbon binding protein